jgi:hypothetical protein
MPQRRTFVAVAACVLLLGLSPAARATEIVSANDTARFLAGISPAADSLAAWTKNSAWQEHARIFDSAFARLEQQQLSRIRAWSERNLTTPRSTMLYMFSGPDFLYANAFFPKATTYVLSGLEPVGTVPDLAAMRGRVALTLHQLRASLSTILSYSFFITHNMRSDLRIGRLTGTLPILYVFLARSGNTIQEVTPVRLDPEGALHSGVDPVRGNATSGVKIVFTSSDGEVRTLYYFNTDLSNDGVRSSRFLKFCETLGPGDSLIKSASYLLHSSGFSIVRDFLLAKSAVVVQDDSGIPLAYYDPQKWDLQSFGHYRGPIATFGSRYQPKYAVFFRNSRPMDFGVGYRWRPHESNLLLAVKTSADAVPETPVQPKVKSGADASEPHSQIHHSARRRAPIQHSAARQRRESASQALTWPWFDWYTRR